MNNQDKELFELAGMVVASYVKNNLNLGAGYCLSFNDLGLADQIAHALNDTNAVEFLPVHERTMLIVEVLNNLAGLSNSKSLFPRQLSFDQVLIADIIKEITLSVFWTKGGHQTLTHLDVQQAVSANSPLMPVNANDETEIIIDAQQIKKNQRNLGGKVVRALKSMISQWRRI